MPADDSAVKRTIEQADHMIEWGDLQQAKDMLIKAGAGLSDSPALTAKLADVSARLERSALLDSIHQALDSKQWRDALDLTDRLPPDDVVAETLRQNARRGLVQALYLQAAAAEAKTDWAEAIARLREVQEYEGTSQSLATRIADDERVLHWSTALRQSAAVAPASEAYESTVFNPPSSLGDDLDDGEGYVEPSELEELAARRFRRMLGAIAIGVVLLLIFGGVALASSGGVLDSLLRPPTPTPTAQPATAEPEATPTAVPALLVEETPTATMTTIPSATRMPTLTPSATMTPTVVPTPTATLAPTQTPSATPTAQPSRTPSPTKALPTSTPQPTSTAQPTPVPSPTNTPQPPATQQPTNTPVPPPTPTRTPVPPTPTPAF